MKNENIVQGFVMLFCSIATIVISLYTVPYCQSVSRVEAAAIRLKRGDSTPVKDGWGRDILTEKVSQPEVVAYGAISPGRDGILKTEDDIISVETDFNKTRIIGKAVGERVKRAAGGFWEGLFNKEKFK